MLRTTGTPFPVSAGAPKSFAHRKVPASSKLAAKTSPLAPALVSVPPPKSTVPTAVPVTTTLPAASTPIPSPLTPAPLEPNALPQTGAPLVSSFATKRFRVAVPATAPLPKSMVPGPGNEPVTTTCPEASAAMVFPKVTAAENVLIQTHPPVGLSFATNAPPVVDGAPQPKSAPLSVLPVTSTFPDASAAMAIPPGRPLKRPSASLPHTGDPLGSSLATKTLPPGGLVSE